MSEHSAAQDETGAPTVSQDVTTPVAQDAVVEPAITDIDESAAGAEPEPTRPPAQLFDVATQRDEALTAAVAAIRAGECIVLPTDTVYGIGANALDAAAVQSLLDAKERGRDMPPPVLIGDAASLGSLVQFIDDDAKALADRYWPGPLTLILRAQEGLRMDLGETRGTIAVRVPDHEFTRALLRRTGPLAVSSANISGQQASTDIAAAREQLGDRVAVYLDGGPTPGRQSSSIIDFSVTTLGTLRREGVLSLDQLREVALFVEPEEPEMTELEPLTAAEPGGSTPAAPPAPTGPGVPRADDPASIQPAQDQLAPEPAEAVKPAEPPTANPQG